MSDPTEAIAAARAAQPAWERTAVGGRARLVARVASAIAADPIAWAQSADASGERDVAEVLGAEIGPTADAAAWLGKHAAKTLRPRRSGGWFDRLTLRVERKPLGVILVIGASNYPLFLTAVPALQALAAGNAALLKPPPGGEACVAKLQEALIEAGIDPRLCPALDSTAEAGSQAIDAGVDHVVLTGSAASGRAVAQRAAERLTPCTLECSGSDSVIAFGQFDVDRVADCVAWGLTFNGGATCIGPRRLIYVGYEGDYLFDPIVERLVARGDVPVSAATAERLRQFLNEELDNGAVLHTPIGWSRQDLHAACDARRVPAIVFMPGKSPTEIGSIDVFAPVLVIEIAHRLDEAIGWVNESRYALGASVFGPPDEAERVAKRLRAGCVTVNDLIAPTADPRVPFGGTGESGYGVTRGPEGLLAMTRPQAIVTRRGRWLPHLDPPSPALPDLLAGMIQSRHATGLAARLRGVRRFLEAATQHRKHNQPQDRAPEQDRA